jgi:signal transduction histidine kinase
MSSRVGLGRLPAEIVATRSPPFGALQTEGTGVDGGSIVWQATPYAPVAFAAALVAVVFAVTMWRSRRGPGTTPLVALALGAAWWSLLYGLELASTTLAAKLLFGRLSYLGIVVVPVAWIAFAVAYTGRGYRLTPTTVGVLSAPAVLAAALPWTSGSTDLFWATTSLVTGGSGVLLALEYGPAFWLWSAYAYSLLAGGTVLLLWSVPLDTRLFRAQTLLLVVGVAAPWLANVTYLFRLLGPETLDLTPLGFVVSALALGSGLKRYELLDVHPAVRAFAREALVERMDEPVVVLTAEGKVVDLNRSARAVLGIPPTDGVGDPLAESAPDLAADIELDDDDADFTTGSPPRHYEVRASPIQGEPGGTVGRLVTLRDVTERRRRERQLAVLNRVLRHDLRNDIAAIRTGAKILTDDPGNEQFVSIVARKAAEMSDLIETIGEVEDSLEAGGPTVTELDLVQVIDDRVEVARHAYPDATVDTDHPASARVETTSLVSSVLDNLIENAVEHNDADEPHVRVSVTRVRADEQPYVEVRVADDGPEIPAHDRQALVRGDEASLERASGLGLWLVNWLVTESGGEVDYEPNEPRGNVVVLRFPTATPDGDTGADHATALESDVDRATPRSSARSTIQRG